MSLFFFVEKVLLRHVLKVYLKFLAFNDLQFFFFVIGGLRKCGLGGAVGLGVSCLYALWNNRDKLQHLSLNPA